MHLVSEHVRFAKGPDGRPTDCRPRLVVPYCSGYWHFEKRHSKSALKLQAVYRGHLGRAAYLRVQKRQLDLRRYAQASEPSRALKSLNEL